MLVQIVLFDGFDLMDAIAPYEVLWAAGTSSGGALQVELVSAEGARQVPSGPSGLPISAGGRLDPRRADVIVVPGAAGSLEEGAADSIPVLLGRAAETELIPLVREALARPGVTVMTVCGGSLLLGMGGLLSGRHSVTHRLAMDALAATGAVPVDARVVDDGNLITGGGVTSGLDTALYLVERELGPRIAHSVETLFEYERRGTVWQARGLAPVGPCAALPHGPEQEVSALTAPVEKDGAKKGDAGIPALFDGVWQAVLSTLIGKKNVTFKISTQNGEVCGTATQNSETVPFIDPVAAADRLTWSQTVSKPFPMKLKFDVTFSGGEMTGTAKPDRLPATSLTGRRTSL